MNQSLTKEKQQNIKDIKEPLTKPEIFLEIFAVVGLLVMIIYSVLKYSALPETIPMHFGFSGEPDAWRSKNNIWVFPAINVALYIMMSCVRFLPGQFNYPVKITPENARKQFKLALIFIGILKVIIIWFFFYLAYITIQVGFAAVSGLNPLWMIVFISLLLASIGLMIYFSVKNK